jgi:hypothetical protein
VKSIINKLFSKKTIGSLLLPFLAVGGCANVDDEQQDNSELNPKEAMTAKAAQDGSGDDYYSEKLQEGANALLEGKVPEGNLEHCITVEGEDGKKRVLTCPPVAPRPEGQ